MRIREYYKETLKKYENNQFVTDIVLRSLIVKSENMANMSEFFLALDKEIKNEFVLNQFVDRVLKGEPYQYVINSQTFLNEEYFVDNNVLIPRMETEELVMTLINTIKHKFHNNEISIADIGTGSGCIAISLKKSLFNAHVFASDISNDALLIAKENAKRLNTEITFYNGNLLEPFIKNNIKVDVLISNPPYISNVEEIDEMVLKYEPNLALLSKNGIDCYEQILGNCGKILSDNAIIAFEFNYDQKEQIAELIKIFLPTANYSFYQDAFKKWRYVIIEYKK